MWAWTVAVCVTLHSPAPTHLVWGCWAQGAAEPISSLKICWAPGWCPSHVLLVATTAECGVRRVFLHVGIPSKGGLHLVKYFAVAKAAGSTFEPFIFSHRPLYCRWQECSLVLESILVHELVEEKDFLILVWFFFGLVFGFVVVFVCLFLLLDVLWALELLRIMRRDWSQRLSSSVFPCSKIYKLWWLRGFSTPEGSPPG